MARAGHAVAYRLADVGDSAAAGGRDLDRTAHGPAPVFGTGLFHYATYDSSFTHESSAALFAAIIFVGVGAMRRRAPPNPWLVFGLALFIVWIREPDALPMLLLVAGWIFWKTRGLVGTERLRDAARLALPALGAIVFVVIFQLLYVRWATHTWSLDDYGSATLN